jgi:hypothetical protein
MKKPAKQTSPKKSVKALPLRAKTAQRYAPDPELRKITVSVPARLIEHKTMGTTELIREALKWYRHKEACDVLRTLRGTLDLGITSQEIKELRD